MDLSNKVQDFPKEILHLMSYILKPDTCVKFINLRVFSGKTVIQYLQEAVDTRSKLTIAQVVEEIVSPWYEAIGYASAPGLMPMEKLIDTVTNNLLAGSD